MWEGEGEGVIVAGVLGASKVVISSFFRFLSLFPVLISWDTSDVILELPLSFLPEEEDSRWYLISKLGNVFFAIFLLPALHFLSPDGSDSGRIV